MRRLLRTVLVVGLLAGVLPQPVAPCEGSSVSLADGIRHAESVYFARVLSVSESADGFADLRLAVEAVVRGPAPADVTRVVSIPVCDSIDVGQHGVVVLGAVDPFGEGPGVVSNLFYRLGPGGTSYREARAVLGASVPATDVADPRAEGRPFDLLVLGVWPLGFVVASLYLITRRAGMRKPR